MVTSIASDATRAYSSATKTNLANSSGSATSNVASSNAAASASAASGPDPAVVITLSSNAQRLQTATNNLTALQTSGTNLAGVWTKDYAEAASIGIDQEPTADAEIAALPASDPDHITQATAAQAFVKANIAAAGTGNTVTAKNPFAGASTQALAAVISDKSGLYTGYEKAAAVYEYQAQQNAWVNQDGPGNPANDNASGKAAYYAKCISVYNNLPSLVQASYPAEYVQTITPLQQFYASGRDDDSLPSVFGNPSNAKNPTQILLEAMLKNATAARSKSGASSS
jgi:hypothetical protein